MPVTSRPFGTSTATERQEARPVEEHTMQVGDGPRVSTITRGMSLTAVEVPDRGGAVGHVLLGLTDLAAYEDNARNPHLGGSIGRFANRIAAGRFELDGHTYELARNNPPNHLHGGVIGFDRVVWDAEAFDDGDRAGVRATYVSSDGEEGYPGRLVATVTQSVGADDLRLEYEATTDAPTVVGFTNHGYWNLSGPGSGPVLDHVLEVAAARYLPVDGGGIPTGPPVPVESTPFDFRVAHPVGDRFAEVRDTPAKGYDHCFVVDGEPGTLRFAARVSDPATGRVMEVSTDQPGVQVYTGNNLADTVGRDGEVHDPYTAICLETERFPDAPHHPDWCPAVLRPGETYRHVTVHRFSTT